MFDRRSQRSSNGAAEITSEIQISRLAQRGVDTIFGLPGDGINGLMEGLRRNADKIRFVLVHHEETAAFMATSDAKATDRIGVCLATSGPGGIHLANGLYDAKLATRQFSRSPACRRAAGSVRRTSRKSTASIPRGAPSSAPPRADHHWESQAVPR